MGILVRLNHPSDPKFVGNATAALAAAEPRPRFRAYGRLQLREIFQLRNFPPNFVAGIDLAARVFPFKVNQYVLDNLIDWQRGPNDPLFRLLFPVPEMMNPDDAAQLAAMIANQEADEKVEAFAADVRKALNPNPADQRLNSPYLDGRLLAGLQHKYRETVLFFPKQGQTCHSYCTFCFRWPQFVRSAPAKFAADDADQLHAYLRRHDDVTDLLLTGGDPMIMSEHRLRRYLQPFIDGRLPHVQTIRIGTKALSYWPFRFVSDQDSDAIIALFRDLRDAGRNVVIMAHINHWREISTDAAQTAIDRLKRAGVVIRSQAPVLRHVNDDSETWRRNWSDQVAAGIVPYYFFIERDTGPRRYFQLPIARALEIYTSALSRVSGLGRSARGPIMSTGPGKIEIAGTLNIDHETFFVLSFIQARRDGWLRRPFLARYSDVAYWLDDLSPPNGQSRFFFAEEYDRFTAEAADQLKAWQQLETQSAPIPTQW